MYKTMAQAFVNAGYKAKPDFKEGWATKLSYRTFKKLESEGYTKFQG